MDDAKPDVIEGGAEIEVREEAEAIVTVGERPRIKLHKSNATVEAMDTQAAGDAPMVSRPSAAPTTELTFLLDLLLNEKLTKQVKEKITERIRLVEVAIQKPVVMPAYSAAQPLPAMPPPYIGPTAAGPLPMQGIHSHLPPPPQMPMPGVVPQGNSVINQALASRQNAIARSFNPNDKPEPGRTGPRKF